MTKLEQQILEEINKGIQMATQELEAPVFGYVNEIEIEFIDND